MRKVSSFDLLSICLIIGLGLNTVSYGDDWESRPLLQRSSQKQKSTRDSKKIDQKNRKKDTVEMPKKSIKKYVYAAGGAVSVVAAGYSFLQYMRGEMLLVNNENSTDNDGQGGIAEDKESALSDKVNDNSTVNGDVLNNEASEGSNKKAWIIGGIVTVAAIVATLYFGGWIHGSSLYGGGAAAIAAAAAAKAAAEALVKTTTEAATAAADAAIKAAKAAAEDAANVGLADAATAAAAAAETAADAATAAAEALQALN